MKKRFTYPARTFVLAIFVFLAGCAGGGKSPEAYRIWGVDLSRHQHPIAWESLGEEKPHFAFVKATEGTGIADPMYRRHTESLSQNGILWGAYHFFGHRTPGREQARHFIATARLGKGNLIPVLDIEDHKFFTDPEKMVREAKAFCREIKKEYGVWPLIYCSSHFYARYLQKDFPDDRYRIWIADYSNVPDAGWTFWQHTDAHPLGGTRVKIDRNVFSGSYEQLKQLVLK